MLHEILLSLSGHPSPLLRPDGSEQGASSAAAIGALSPSERELLATVAHLSDLHVKLLGYSAQIAASHPSTICRAVATTIESTHLRAFQQKILDVEEAILRRDASLVGAYDIVPLTAVVGEFSGWTRRMEWLWEMVQFMLLRLKEPQEGRLGGKHGTEGNRDGDGRERERQPLCRGAQLIDRLRAELQSGYADVESTALSLVAVAETAWLKQVSAWVLYGRLPSFGGDDFFVRKAEGSEQDFIAVPSLTPSFVTPSTTSTILFIGKSLNHFRVKASLESGPHVVDRHLSSQLAELSALTFPLNAAAFSRAMSSVRLSLSRNTLQKLLPLAKVVDMLRLLREFFLLGRGEFAMALTQEADEKLRSRWKRADNLAYEKREGLGAIVVKDGEVASVLAKTWAVMVALQGQQADEDEGLELARELLRLSITKSKPGTPLKLGSASGRGTGSILAQTPFRNLLLSTPVVLTLAIPSPFDMVLTPADLHVYAAINSYLLAIRRAHIRLTDLWKITALRRHHPAPPKLAKGGRSRVVLLRKRYAARASAMRSAWVTCSAAVFFFAETGAYLQTEVVAGLWDGFQAWLSSEDAEAANNSAGPAPAAGPATAKSPPPSTAQSRNKGPIRNADRGEEEDEDEEDIWLTEQSGRHTTTSPPRHPSTSARTPQPHDPQTIAIAHARFLTALSRRLLLTQEAFTDELYALLVHADHLVALVHRLQAIWAARDLEADAGVVDAFLDLENEEADVIAQLRAVETQVRDGIQAVIASLRELETDPVFMAQLDGEEDITGVGGSTEGEVARGLTLREEGEYAPRRVGGIDRLLMKLDFGFWFDSGGRANLAAGELEEGYDGGRDDF